MKKIILLTCSFFAFVLFAYQSPSPVSYVDTKKFNGLWYEIARTYNSFEKDCVAATVEYQMTGSLQYNVTNRCFDKKIGGDLIVYNGTASSTNKKSMAELEKTYFWIFSKDYKIIYLKDYKTAIMADDAMEHVWIMHREPTMHQDSLTQLVSFLDKYMDTKKLIFTPQDKNGRYK